MKIEIINPLEYPQWDELLLTCNQSNFFHSTAWSRVLYESYGFKPVFFIIVCDGRLSGLISAMSISSFITGRRGVAMPFSDYCPVIARDEECFRNLLAHVLDFGIAEKWKSIEFRGGKFLNGEPAIEGHLIHTLDLDSGIDFVHNNFKASTRRNISKSEREGVEVELTNSLAAIKDFYRLNCITRKNHGLPPQPWSFFRNFYKHIIETDKGFVSLAKYRGKSIAAAVFVRFRREGIYKYGASEIRYQHLRPNNLIMWEAIKWFCRNGFRILNFGRTEPENQGLRQFKRGWGTCEEEISYHKYDVATRSFNCVNNGPKASYKIFKIMPEPILKLSGKLLYRHFG